MCIFIVIIRFQAICRLSIDEIQGWALLKPHSLDSLLGMIFILKYHDLYLDVSAGFSELKLYLELYPLNHI